MERAMSVEDKIRRAEEIYNRRRENEFKGVQARRVDTNNEVENQNINKKLKKMIVQIIVCMLIYFIFYYATNSNYVFSENFRKKCQEMLAYDISFSEAYKKIVDGITVLKEKYEETSFKNNKENNVDGNIEENNQEDNQETTQESTEQEKDNNNEENSDQEMEQNNENLTMQENNTQSQESIGGATESVADNNQENVESTENLTEEEQMKRDAEQIKAKISFIKPLEGTITSVFGWRNPTVSTVSKYHTGIDIAANKGTEIISATNGKVVLASSEGAYGNHLKIQIEDVIIIYAHCLSLEVREGNQISQGQVIAKVGSTGNSTGPHLHFEIRKEDRYVNPDLILDFFK